jgi:gas vesicle structural protein
LPFCQKGVRLFMTVAARPHNRYLDRPSPSSLADVIDTILDKGLVIDIYVRVSLVGIELLTVDARIVMPVSTLISGLPKP